MDVIKIFMGYTNDESYFVGDYEISTMCLQSMPCQHSMRKKNGEWGHFRGDSIYLMLKKDNLNHVHFDKYAEFIRKQNDPVEIEIRRQERIKTEEIIKARDIENRQTQEHIDNFKASSRLEKLHKLNAIA